MKFRLRPVKLPALPKQLVKLIRKKSADLPSSAAAAVADRAHLNTQLVDLPDGPLADVLHNLLACRPACRALHRLCDEARTHLRLRAGGGGAAQQHPTPLELAQFIARMPRLETLHALDVPTSDVAALARPSLTVLEAQLCQGPGGDTLAPLGACAKLTTVHLSRCLDLTSLSERLCLCRSLTTLGLYDCPRLCDIGQLAGCPALANLGIAGASLTDLRPLTHCPALSALTLHNCDGVTNLAPMAACPALTSLSLSACRSLTSVAPLVACARLARLAVWSCNVLFDLGVLSKCCPLRTLLVDKDRHEGCVALAHARQDLRIVYTDA